jgi:hypothetical protein
MMSNHTVTVYYPSTVLSAYQDIESIIQLAILETNQAYQYSNIPIHLSLAYHGVGTLSDYYDAYTLLTSFRGTDRKGANMAVMLSTQLNACGIAYLDVTTISNPGPYSYAVVQVSCATGYYSFSHELSHLSGADHNTGFNTPSARFPDNMGYIMLSGGNGLRTIMSYAVDGETRIQRFSNPSVSYQGYVTGVLGSTNNARVITATRYAIANIK